MISTFAKFCLILIVVGLLTSASPVQSAVETSLQNTLQTGAVPIDVAVSPDGRSTFVLTDEGNVVVYDDLGKLSETIKFDRITKRASGWASGVYRLSLSTAKKFVTAV